MYAPREEERFSSIQHVRRWSVYALLIAFVVVLLTLAFPHIVQWLKERYFAEAAETPEIFSAVSAYFSAIAFGLLILTVILQAYELSLQRRELEDTRIVLKQQADTLALQQFDSTFFNLLSLHNEIVRGLVMVGHNIARRHTATGTVEYVLEEPLRFEGQEVAPALLRKVDYELEENRNSLPRTTGLPEAKAEDQYMDAYSKIFSAHRDLLGHYFRNLYHVVKFVDRSNIDQKTQYTAFVRAQLSGSEIQLLFFNCKSKWGTGFERMAIDYALLEHLPLDEHVPDALLLMYDEKAYGSNGEILERYRRAKKERDNPPAQVKDAH